MFEGLSKRVSATAERAVEQQLRGVEETIRRGVPSGIDVRREEGQVVLSGRGLRRRLITEAGLRWLWRRA